MAYRLVTDVCCDLPLDYALAHDLVVLPMYVEIEGTEYKITVDPADPAAIDSHFFYDKLRKGVPAKTTQITSPRFVEAFEPMLAAGDDVLYLAFSGGLSGTCDSACVARLELMDKYPDRKLVVVDTLCASMGLGLLVHLCALKREDGMGLDALAEYAMGLRQKVHHWVTVDDLSHLRRGGRVSGPMALLGTVLSIKPILRIDQEGHLPAVDKVQGRKRALRYLVDRMEQEAVMPVRDAVFLSHGDAPEDAQAVAAMIKTRLGVDVMLINAISPIIGGHSGPGTIALFFVSGADR